MSSSGLKVSGHRFDSLFIYAMVYLTFLYGPVLVLPLFSFNDSLYVAFPLKGFTLDWYHAMANQTQLVNSLLNSLKVAAIVSVISTILGTLAAKGVTRYRITGHGTIVGFIMIPLVIPLIILGISLLVLINSIGLPLSLFTIGISHVLITVPFAMMVMISRLEGFDKHLEETSWDLGESNWVTFWRVTFPLVLPGIVASLLLCFTWSFDEFILAFFLAGKEPTLPLYIWSQLRFPKKLPNVLALGTCILLASAVMIIVASKIRSIGLKSDQKTGNLV
ncbi:MAG: ABC transporter permease [Dehalococcoidia bacterium]|nr:ABC transporter permease [Dehalococcoidia bacterium]